MGKNAQRRRANCSTTRPTTTTPDDQRLKELQTFVLDMCEEEFGERVIPDQLQDALGHGHLTIRCMKCRTAFEITCSCEEPGTVSDPCLCLIRYVYCPWCGVCLLQEAKHRHG
jgi:hypothetical protein